MKKITLSAMIIVSLLFALVTTIHSASIPELINYQGKVLKADGSAYLVGEYKLSFSIYDSTTGGTVVWGPL